MVERESDPDTDTDTDTDLRTDGPGAVEAAVGGTDLDGIDGAGATGGDGGVLSKRRLAAAGLVAVFVLVGGVALVGTFVLNIGYDHPVVPLAGMEFEYDAVDGTVTVTHAGGDTFTDENAAAVRVVGTESGTLVRYSAFPFGVGDVLLHEAPVEAGETLRVIGEAPDHDDDGEAETRVVATFEVPSGSG